MNVRSQNATHALSVVFGVASQLLRFPDADPNPNHVRFLNFLPNHVCAAILPFYPRQIRSYSAPLP